MAVKLSCFDVVKSRSRQTPNRGNKVADRDNYSNKSKKTSPNHLLDIEVLEQEEYRVKIHYTGYSARHDRWIRKSEIEYKPASTTVPDKKLSLLAVLACAIKQKLVPSRKLEDPDVRLQLPFDRNTFTLLQQCGKPLGTFHGNRTYTIEKYSDLDPLLGKHWYIRVTNIYGDFSTVILEMIRFYLMQPRPLLDIDFKKDVTGELNFTPSYLEQEMVIVFKFVRQDENRQRLSNFIE